MKRDEISVKTILPVLLERTHTQRYTISKIQQKLNTADAILTYNSSKTPGDKRLFKHISGKISEIIQNKIKE